MNAPAHLPEHAELSSAFQRLRAAAQAQPYPAAEERRGWLKALHEALVRHEEALCAAMDADFGGRAVMETKLTELFPALEALGYARRHLRRWMRPERRPVSLWFQPAKARLHYQPKGLVGVIVPWNYPLYLAIGPLAGALAAGNRVLVKVSEYTPKTGELLARILAECLPAGLVEVVNGGPELAAAFSRLPFDHLLYTGSTAIGREVMKAAAENLVPVTLELGGKSPTLIAPGFDLDVAAKRICFAKFLNAGQICVSPDYVLVPEGQEQAFAEAVRRVVQSFYGSERSEMTSIISERHHARLCALLDEAQAKGARLLPLLDGKLSGRQLMPTAVMGATEDMRILQEEIFGPLLPILGYRDTEAAIAYINGHPRPLAFYVFDEDKARREDVLARTHSGGACINECLVQIAQDALPFGGIGPSGMGSYHGPEGFKTFSHAKGVFTQSRLNTLSLFHPPHGRLARILLRLILKCS
ncbi:MAG: coniferyl aldehyde dehydrogenase [Gammaproteobacteria bacterium]|nr:coniferyl aldehyde dehydrogenase [Gammaproteobacteria bacterium]